MRDLDLITLRMFLAVCDQGSIARAAEHENAVPSAVSKRIAQLERTVGATLLVRGRRGVSPTPAGAVLLEHSRSMLFTAGRIEADVAALSGGMRGQIRILATTSALAESLLDDVALFMRDPAHRDIKLDIEERTTAEVLRILREGSAGIGVCWHNTRLDGLQHRAYRSDQLGLAVHRDHPLAARTSLKVTDALDFEHVGLPPSAAISVGLQRAAARAGRTVNYKAIVSNLDAAFRVVEANLAVGVIPLQVRSPQAAGTQVVMIPLTDTWAHRRFALCFRDFNLLDPAGKRMVEHLERLAKACS